MAKEISGVPLASALTGAEEILIVQGGNSRRVSLATLAQWVKVAESIVPASVPWRGAKVRLSTDVTGVTFPHIIGWATEIEDTDGFWTVGTPTRFTIPAGISKVRLECCVSVESLGVVGTLYVSINKNGAGFLGNHAPTSRQGSTGFTTNAWASWTWDENVVAGDYFEVRLNVSGLAGVDVVLNTNQTFFALTVVEAIP